MKGRIQPKIQSGGQAIEFPALILWAYLMSSSDDIFLLLA